MTGEKRTGLAIGVVAIIIGASLRLEPRVASLALMVVGLVALPVACYASALFAGPHRFLLHFANRAGVQARSSAPLTRGEFARLCAHVIAIAVGASAVVVEWSKLGFPPRASPALGWILATAWLGYVITESTSKTYVNRPIVRTTAKILLCAQLVIAFTHALGEDDTTRKPGEFTRWAALSDTAEARVLKSIPKPSASLAQRLIASRVALPEDSVFSKGVCFTLSVVSSARERGVRIHWGQVLAPGIVDATYRAEIIEEDDRGILEIKLGVGPVPSSSDLEVQLWATGDRSQPPNPERDIGVYGPNSCEVGEGR